MEPIEKSIEIIELYDYYADLLTKKQKEYLTAYYHDDYSITEISENFDISRNAVFDQIKRSVAKLYDYEAKLGLHQKAIKIQEIIEQIKQETKSETIQSLVAELEKVV